MKDPSGREMLWKILVICSLGILLALGSPSSVCADDDDSGPSGKDVPPASFIPRGQRVQACDFGDYALAVYCRASENVPSIWQLEIRKAGTCVYAYETTCADLRILGDRKDQDETAVRVGAEVAGPGLPCAVVSENSGGSHCCTVFHFFQLTSSFKKLPDFSALDSEFLNPFQTKPGEPIRFRIPDFTFRYFRTAFAFSPTPEMVLWFRDGKLVADTESMKRPPFSEKVLRGEASQMHDEIAAKPGYSVIESKMTKRILELIYSGNADQAMEMLDLAWPSNLTGKDDYLRQLANTLSGSSIWESIKEMNQNKATRLDAALADFKATQQKNAEKATAWWLDRLVTFDTDVPGSQETNAQMGKRIEMAKEAQAELEKRRKELAAHPELLKLAVLKGSFSAEALLEELNPSGAPVLQSIAEDVSVDCKIRSSALNSLSEMGDAGRAAVPIAVKAWGNERACLGRAAVQVLSYGSWVSPEAKAVLLEAVNDPSSLDSIDCCRASTVAEACRGLNKYPTADVVALLRRLKGGQDADLAGAANLALKMIEESREKSGSSINKSVDVQAPLR